MSYYYCELRIFSENCNDFEEFQDLLDLTSNRRWSKRVLNNKKNKFLVNVDYSSGCYDRGETKRWKFSKNFYTNFAFGGEDWSDLLKSSVMPYPSNPNPITLLELCEKKKIDMCGIIVVVDDTYSVKPGEDMQETKFTIINGVVHTEPTLKGKILHITGPYNIGTEDKLKDFNKENSTAYTEADKRIFSSRVLFTDLPARTPLPEKREDL